MNKKRYVFSSLILSLLVFLLYSYPHHAQENDALELTLSVAAVPEGDKIPLESATIKYGSLIYTAQERTQTIPTVVTAVVDGETVELKKNRDFKVKYENNLNAGIAAMTISGTGNYTGTIVKHFKIRPVRLTSAVLEFKEAEYTGKPVTQTHSTVVKARVAGQMRTLDSMTDYTITYTNNTDVGTATMTITGKGNYTGSITETFEIVPKQ